MVELNKKEMVIRYGTIGFVLGILLSVTLYFLLLLGLNTPFSFTVIGQIHHQFHFLYIIDFLAVAGLFSGMRIGCWRFSQLDQLSFRIRQETEMNNEIKRFTQKLIQGDLQTSVSLSLSDLTLSDSLNKLKDSLVSNREMERQRRLDERQRNWVSEGLAEFGDILRKESGDMKSMTYAVISEMVKYLDANQGALFLTEDGVEGKFLTMSASYAYNRKKYPDKKAAWGTGLIGATALEKKGYYTDKIPNGYLTITSGLGKANPRYLLIEPMVWNGQVFGIIEIASFTALQEYKIQFVRRVAENIATTINTMESNIRTEQLLKETQAQAGMLAAQEEQVRQNMEALKTAQEEAARQTETFIRFTDTVNHTLMRAEYDTEGMLLYANTSFLKKLGYSGNREVEGKHISMFINEKDRPWFNSIWVDLAKGGLHFEGSMKHETKLGQDLWTMATYTSVRQDNGEVEKILFLAIDSTEQKKQSLDYEGQIEALDRLNAKAIFSPDGKLQSSNNLFNEPLKYTEIELGQMNVFDFFTTGEQERFNEIWDHVIRGEAFQGQLKMQSKYDDELWFRATFLSANDMYGEVEKVIFLASEITKEKEAEFASRKQHEQLIKKEEDLLLSGLDLKKKLEETNKIREEEKRRFNKEIRQYSNVLKELPYPVISINNTGFVLFFNRQAEKIWELKQKEVMGTRVGSLFGSNNRSEVISAFIDPARTKTPGLHPGEEFILHNGKKLHRELMLIRTDLKDELHYSLVVL